MINPSSMHVAPFDWSQQVSQYHAQNERRARGVTGSGVPRARAKLPPPRWWEDQMKITEASVCLALVLSAVVAGVGFVFLVVAIAGALK